MRCLAAAEELSAYCGVIFTCGKTLWAFDVVIWFRSDWHSNGSVDPAMQLGGKRRRGAPDPATTLSILTAAIGIFSLVITCLAAPAAWAIEELVTEEDISDLLIPQMESHGKAEGRQWAVVPQLGYGPDTGPVVGVKFTHRNLLRTGITLDVDATYAALNNQQSHGIKIMQPHLFGDRFLITAYGKVRYDPEREFFGLGNNDRGPDPASTHAYQDMFGVLALGWRLLPRVSLNFSVMFREVDIRHGDQRDDCGGLVPCPFTQDPASEGGFAGMPGVNGGKSNPLSLSLVWNDRDDITHPTRGWLVLVKASHTDKALWSNFEFTRVVGDAGYLYPWFDKRLVTGARLDGVWMDGPSGEFPFWELTDLGGADSLRGFFPRRFAGKKRLLINLEARGLLKEFDFFNLWHVKLDGVLFGETGRVFLDSTEINHEFHAARPDIHYVSHLQYSYGGGLRIALSSALIARIDVGFSEEEQGLVYLTFGETF